MRIERSLAGANRAFFLLSGLALLACGCTTSGPKPLGNELSFNTAKAMLASGSPAVALEICDQRIVRSPRDAELLLCRGDALTQLGRASEAGAAYLAVLQVDGGSAAARLGLGRLRLATDPAAAETLFVEALARNPRDPAVLNNLGIARDLQGRHADAQTAYGEAIAAAPQLRAPQVNLALSLAMTGKAGEAVRILRPIAEAPDASPRERHDLAAVLAMEGKGDEAARMLRPELDGAQADDALAGFRALPAR